MLLMTFRDGVRADYIPRTFPIPTPDRPVFFDLGAYLQRLGPEVPISITDLQLIEALGVVLTLN